MQAISAHLYLCCEWRQSNFVAMMWLVRGRGMAAHAGVSLAC